MAEPTTLGQWLQQKCQEQGLSLRQTAAKTGLSHVTIADIMRGTSPSATTIIRLAEAFGGNHHQRFVVEDKLLTISGHRSQRPREEFSEPLARLLDRLIGFNDAELKVMESFADFLSEKEEK